MDNQNQTQPISSNPASINKDNKDTGFYRKRAWLKWLLIYFVIATLIYGGAYLVLSRKSSKPYSINHPNPTITIQPITTSDKTSNWKTYRNEEFGFEVKYPEKCSKILENVGGLFSVSCTVDDVEFVERFVFSSWGHVGFSCGSIKECESSFNFSTIDYKDHNTAIIERTRNGNKEFALSL